MTRARGDRHGVDIRAMRRHRPQCAGVGDLVGCVAAPVGVDGQKLAPRRVGADTRNFGD
jgi:hypothetical protein